MLFRSEPQRHPVVRPTGRPAVGEDPDRRRPQPGRFPRLSAAPAVMAAVLGDPALPPGRPRDPSRRIEEVVVETIRFALAHDGGSLLVFLPGQSEIKRSAELLAEKINSPLIEIAPLYGAMDAADQDKAIAPAKPGSRKIVLATSIAETSLTIEGVRVVIDSGLARVPRFEPDLGLTRLETMRVSRAAADQRRGQHADADGNA